MKVIGRRVNDHPHVWQSEWVGAQVPVGLDSADVVAISPAFSAEAALQPDPAAYTRIHTSDIAFYIFGEAPASCRLGGQRSTRGAKICANEERTKQDVWGRQNRNRNVNGRGSALTCAGCCLLCSLFLLMRVTRQPNLCQPAKFSVVQAWTGRWEAITTLPPAG